MTLIKTNANEQSAAFSAAEDAFDPEKLKKLPNRSLFQHLYEKGILSEQEVKKLKKYIKLYGHSKMDIGAPQVVQSQIGSISSKFSPEKQSSTPNFSDQNEQNLINFRNCQRELHKRHKDLISFAERLFDEPKNLLDFYSSWSPFQQKSGALALKKLAVMI